MTAPTFDVFVDEPPEPDRFDRAADSLEAEWTRWQQEATEPAVVEVYDRDWDFMGYADGVLEGDVEDVKNDAGEASVQFDADSLAARWMVDDVDETEDIHLRITQGGNEWCGKAQTISEEMDESGREVVTWEGLHDLQHAKKLYCFPNPWALVQAQWPKEYIYYGPAITGIKQLLLVNLMRRYQHGWAPAPDMFSERSYRTLDPDRWAQIVNPLGANLFEDTSMHAIIVSRMGQFHEVVKPILEDAGLMLTATRWFPGDPQPFPEHCVLSMPTLIWDVVDKSGVRGPAGNLIDGFIQLVRSISEDGVTETIDAVPYEVPDEYSEPGFWGTTDEIPAVVFYQQQRWTGVAGSGIVGVTRWKRVVHKALGSAIMTGGKSPGWVNSGIKMFANAILGWIGMIFLNPGLTLGLLDDQVEDVILAFARWPLDDRAKKMGRDRYGEVWESSGSTGFSFSTIAAIRAGRESTAAYTSYELEVQHALPYIVGKHFDIGDRTAAEIGRSGRLYVDELRTKRLQFSPSGSQYTLAIGVDSEERSPSARIGRVLESVSQLVQMISVQS